MEFKMDRKKYPKPKRDGFAMAMMLCAIILLFLAGLGTLTLGMHSRMLGVRTCSELAARSAADSGLTKALFEMNQKLQVLPFKDTDRSEERRVGEEWRSR